MKPSTIIVILLEGMRQACSLPPYMRERIFGRVERSVTRKVSESWELSDTPNNPRQGWGG